MPGRAARPPSVPILLSNFKKLEKCPPESNNTNLKAAGQRAEQGCGVRRWCVPTLPLPRVASQAAPHTAGLPRCKVRGRRDEGHVTIKCYLDRNCLRDEVRASRGSSTLPPTEERAVDDGNQNCSLWPQLTEDDDSDCP